MFAMYRLGDDVVLRRRLGIVLIGIIVVSVIKNLSIIVIISVRSFYIKFRTWVHKKINHKQGERERIIKERETERLKEEEKKFDEELLRTNGQLQTSNIPNDESELKDSIYHK